MAGDATALGEQDRIDEVKKGKSLTNRWSARTIGKAFVSNPSSFDNFVSTYRVGSEQQAQAIRSGRELSRVDEHRLNERSGSMSEVNSFLYQSQCCIKVAAKLEEFAGDNLKSYQSFSEKVDSLITKGILGNFHSSLNLIRLTYKTQVDHLSVTLKSHAEDFRKYAAFLKQLDDKGFTP